MGTVKNLPTRQPEAVNRAETRTRRLRRTDTLRSLVRETHLQPADFIYPMFIEEGLTEASPVKSMPGVSRETEKSIVKAVREAADAGVRSVMLFGIPQHKDHAGSDSLKPDGLMGRMIRTVKDACPDVAVIADICFCEYTDHGHCGVLTPCGDVDNDRTLDNLARQAFVAAQAGADIVAPSGMMDGMVAAIRGGLDESGFENMPIMSYSTKFASNFYGPFREAAGCGLGQGNRKTYQMDPANAREALRESLIDEAEGADILMVKPGMAYLDILAKLREQTLLPLAAYQVSGEYAMIKFAAQAGAINEQDVMMETLLAFKRAGADLILSYFSVDALRLLQR